LIEPTGEQQIVHILRCFVSDPTVCQAGVAECDLSGDEGAIAQGKSIFAIS
jgi:hypothetical protein